jgi:dTDP-4-amino-4,6-dideoxygalactose transaminase
MIEIYSPTIRRKEMDAVLTALVEDRVGPGEGAELLVQIAREHIDFDFCVSVRSPAIALFLALQLLNIEEGKGVVISALSPLYYMRVIEDMRLRPVLCDVAPGYTYPDREHIQEAFSHDAGNVRAIVLHHTLGFTPSTASIAELGLPIIEDCSQSYGTVYTQVDGAAKPSFGTFTILGLEERDVLTSGGGALLYASLRRDASVLRNMGNLPKEYGLPDMNAAMAMVQFREAAKNCAKRKEIAEVYTQASIRTRHKRFLGREEAEYNNYAFPLILETGMKDVKSYAKRKDIEIESAFSVAVIGSEKVESGHYPEAYSLSLRTALFPLYPRLRSSEIEKVSKLIGTLP